MTNAEAWFNIALCPRKPEGSLGWTAQDGHLDSHTAPELWVPMCNLFLALYALFPLFLCSSQQMGCSPHSPPQTHTHTHTHHHPPTWQQQPAMVKWLTLLMSAKNCSDNSLMERRKYIHRHLSAVVSFLVVTATIVLGEGFEFAHLCFCPLW